MHIMQSLTDLRRRAVHAASAIVIIAGCSSIDAPAIYEPITDPAQLFMGLTLNHQAVNMSTAAPYNELQLIATPRDGSGAAIDWVDAPTFRSSDTTRVWVSPAGLLTARAPGTSIRIIAEILAEGNNRRADTTLVNVTSNPTPPVPATFSIHPVPPETATWAIAPIQGLFGNIFLSPVGINLTPRLTLRIRDAADAPITGLQVHYASLDPEIVFVHPTFGGITPSRPGQARLVVSTVAWGVAYADTVTYTVTLPRVHGVQFQIQPDSTFKIEPTAVRIIEGGYVFWANFSTKAVDVTFDDPASASEIPEVCARFGGAMCGAGNIPAFDGRTGQLNGIRGRQFHTAGEYTFRDSGSGVEGTVIVVRPDGD